MSTTPEVLDIAREREDFEADFRSNFPEYKMGIVAKHQSGDYLDVLVEARWLGWQARASASQQQSAPPVAKPAAWVWDGSLAGTVTPLYAAPQTAETDDLLRTLNLDPERYRTEGGAPNLPKIKAAMTHTDEYPRWEPAPSTVADLRCAKWLDPECADAGACQSFKFKAAQPAPGVREALVALVALKDLKLRMQALSEEMRRQGYWTQGLHAEWTDCHLTYATDKEPAWAAARAALSTPSVQASEPATMGFRAVQLAKPNPLQFDDLQASEPEAKR
jgi:hypothetical protein